jgi:hypothetical protein
MKNDTMNLIRQAMAGVARFGALGKTVDEPPHQTHVRKAETAKAICNPAGSKLLKRFAKAESRPAPRGF